MCPALPIHPHTHTHVRADLTSRKYYICGSASLAAPGGLPSPVAPGFIYNGGVHDDAPMCTEDCSDEYIRDITQLSSINRVYVTGLADCSGEFIIDRSRSDSSPEHVLIGSPIFSRIFSTPKKDDSKEGEEVRPIDLYRCAGSGRWALGWDDNEVACSTTSSILPIGLAWTQVTAYPKDGEVNPMIRVIAVGDFGFPEEIVARIPSHGMVMLFLIHPAAAESDSPIINAIYEKKVILNGNYEEKIRVHRIEEDGCWDLCRSLHRVMDGAILDGPPVNSSHWRTSDSDEVLPTTCSSWYHFVPDDEWILTPTFSIRELTADEEECYPCRAITIEGNHPHCGVYLEYEDQTFRSATLPRKWRCILEHLHDKNPVNGCWVLWGPAAFASQEASRRTFDGVVYSVILFSETPSLSPCGLMYDQASFRVRRSTEEEHVDALAILASLRLEEDVQEARADFIQTHSKGGDIFDEYVQSHGRQEAVDFFTDIALRAELERERMELIRVRREDGNVGRGEDPESTEDDAGVDGSGSIDSGVSGGYVEVGASDAEDEGDEEGADGSGNEDWIDAPNESNESDKGINSDESDGET